MDPKKPAPKNSEQAATGGLSRNLPVLGPRLRKTGVKGAAARVTRSKQQEQEQQKQEEDVGTRIAVLEDQLLTVLRRMADLEQQVEAQERNRPDELYERVSELERDVEIHDESIGELVTRLKDVEVTIQFSDVTRMDAQMPVRK